MGVIVYSADGTKREATPAEEARFIYATEDTDPAFCDCGHAGLARGFHSTSCLMRLIPYAKHDAKGWRSMSSTDLYRMVTQRPGARHD